MTQEPMSVRRPDAGFARWLGVVCAAMFLGGWLARGVASVGLESRGVYERFGAPVAVLHPGLHLVMPWPFGRVRLLDFGAVREVEVAAPGLRVLYRVGLSDSEALDAAYGSADPGGLVRAAASDAVMARSVGGALQGTIQAALDRADCGLEVLAVLPGPVDAGGGAHAAEISVEAVLDEARGDAVVERARARQDAAAMVAAARAKAAEIVAAARTGAVQFDGDRAADKDGGKSFLLERYFADLTQAIGSAPKTIIDHRLNWPTAPELDLRPPPGVAPVIAPWGKG
jgi:regulator of protease activity HflC (stomatin/prohibitin superfamily)